MRYSFSIVLLLFALKSYGQTAPLNDTLHWKETRPITWEDFKGDEILGIGVNGEVFCMNLANFEKPGLFQKPKYIVTSIFDRTKSWTTKDFRTPQTLLYFQVMFNIYEVHARNLRKVFSEAKFGSDPTAKFQEAYNTSMTNLTNEFNQYRKETKLGSDSAALKEWKIKIDTELLTLDLYK